MKEEKPSKFLVKLLNILRSKQYAKIISWDSQLKGIKILNPQRLQTEILPRYYRHNRVSSFVRQLNMYDFHKINLQNGTSLFFHSQFNPKNKDSIIGIKRKTNISEKQEKEDKEESPPVLKWEEIENRPIEQLEEKYQKTKPRESFQLLFPRSSFNSFNDMINSRKQINHELILDQILSQMQSLAILSPNTIKDKISELKTIKKFRRFLKRGSFLSKLYAKLGIEMEQDDKLSELSIEEDLLFETNTRKSVTLRSFKMFDSGTIYLRDTLGMFMN